MNKEKEPITPQQLSDALTRSGYDKVVKNLGLPPSTEVKIKGHVPTPEEANQLLDNYKKLKI